jgi:hypothetical protein
VAFWLWILPHNTSPEEIFAATDWKERSPLFSLHPSLLRIAINKIEALLNARMICPHPQPLYLKDREIDRKPLDARHRGEARVISLIK